jgi:hypothetical protein
MQSAYTHTCHTCMHLPSLLFGKPVSAPKMNASAMHALHTVPGLGMEPQAHEEIVDPRDRTYSHQGWKIASWIPSLLLPTHPPTHEFFSLPKVSPNLSEIRSQLRLRATFFISTPEFLRRAAHGSLRSSLTKKIAVVGLEEQDCQIIRVWVLHGLFVL